MGRQTKMYVAAITTQAHRGLHHAHRRRWHERPSIGINNTQVVADGANTSDTTERLVNR